MLVTFALTYFDREVRVRDLDRIALQHFVDWLTNRPGRSGRLCDRSIANAMTPLRLALDALSRKFPRMERWITASREFEARRRLLR